MAPGSPRARIDQFFSSKKRKSLSPALKSGRVEKDSRNAAEGSPSAKGTLDNYLVSAQDETGAPKPLDSGLLARQDPVKRSLALEIDKISEGGSTGQFSSSRNQSQTPKAAGIVQKETSQGSSNVGERRMEDPELKQFATDFLSLYLSELQSTSTSPSKPKLKGPKRQGDPLVDAENKTSKKRHVSSPEKTKPEDRQSALVLKTGVSVFSHSREAAVGNDPVQLQSSLRKCNKVPTSTANVIECSTPGSLVVKQRVRETPMSTRGSSIFSPGEAFWNEAIQIADGLFVETDEPQVSGHNKNENPGNESKEVLDEASHRDCLMTNGGSLELLTKHLKNSVKEVSPLPVKHLDFLFEDKNSDVTILHCPADNSNTHRGDDRSECGSANLNGLPSTNVGSWISESRTNEEMHDAQETVSAHSTTKRRADVSDQDTDSRVSDSPSNEIKNLIGNNELGTPSSCVPFKDRLDLSNWLPPEVCSIYRSRGISKLYAWQVDCLQVDGVLQRRNLVYCASTSAGKSFVAEILMLQRVISTGKIAMLVLPYVSICAEKAEHLERILEPLGKHVRSYYGNQGGGTLPKDTSVAVCTIEKANSLMNRLLEEGRLSEIGIIVIDELHMVGDQSRGYLLELLLTKLRYAAGEGSSESSSGESSGTSSKADPAHGLQIVGMSATMPNVAAVADWLQVSDITEEDKLYLVKCDVSLQLSASLGGLLQAALYQTDFRPVPLEEYIKVGNTIYDKKMDIVRTISKAADLDGKDPDHIVQLCNEVVQEGHSVLIFCSSRKGCESTARHVSKFLKKFYIKLDKDSKFADIAAAIDGLRKSPAGLDPTLEETLPSGVAYHHAGLTVEEREIIETCYRKGLLQVLTATSTLAAGVNLPARRVIFRQPKIGCDFIDGTRYRQMAGRAGRTGIDTKGESVLICKPEELKRVRGLINESCLLLQSCLSEDKNGMTHAILEVVAGGIVQTADDIHRYVRCTLLNSTKPFRDVVKSAQDSLRWLCHRKFLEWNEDTKLYSSTPLGRASFGSSLCPEESLIVLDDLCKAREGFVLASDLHLVFLVTPINVDVEPDWELYYERFMQLSPLDQSVGNRVGVSEPFLMRMAHGASMSSLNRSTNRKKGFQGKFENQSGRANNNVISDEETLRVCKRFYVALMLSRLVQEVPVPEVCEAFKVARGMVQALQENAGRFASMVSVFCERLGWHDLEGLVSKFQNRVSFGVRAEIVELTTIPFVKGSRARALYKAGLRTPVAIAEASIPEIVKAVFESSSWAVQEVSAQRRIQLGVAKKIKNGARKIVLDKAEEARIAAFSAFKSLGLNVPQFSRPLLINASRDLDEREDANISFGDEAGNTGVSVEQNMHASPKLEINTSSGEVISLNGDHKPIRTSSISLMAPLEAKGNGPMQSDNSDENSTEPVKKSTLGIELDAVSDHKNILSVQVEQKDDGGLKYEGNVDNGVQQQCGGKTLPTGNKDGANEMGPINASNVSGGFDSFLDLWDSAHEFCFDIHYNKLSEANSIVPFEVHGIAICWENSPVYYISLPKDLLHDKQGNNYLPITASAQKSSTILPDTSLEMLRHRWNRIAEIFRKRDVKKFTWNLKIQIQVLKSAVVTSPRLGVLNLSEKLDLELIDSSHLLLPPINIRGGIDMCIVVWILWPDEERSSNPNLDKEVKRRLTSEVVAAANGHGRWKNHMRRAAHNGCCRRVAQTRALCSVLWKLLISEGLFEALNNIESPLVNVLADMELWGIGIDMESCLKARNVLGKKLKSLEKMAYKLAGMTFSLHTAADIANLLYEHLKLPIPEGHNKGKLHPSTDKSCLDLLRHEHPIIPVIREHRTLAKLLNTTLGSICSLARLSMRTQKYTLHGHWLQTSTATGRLSMEEPNLQCVEHDVEFEMNTDESGPDADGVYYKINARDFFVPTQDNWLLLTADYSQIELRLLAHFSKDASLIELLSKPDGDVFTMIAAKWTGKPEDSVASDERDQTKRLVYGILYGMGANTLAEQLDCSSEEAKEKIKSFKSSFPGVASWLHEAVVSCRKKGYIETLKGRKRFLSKIKFGTSDEKAKAQRQAVNSVCQGSAADVIKIAMINIHSVIDGEVSKMHFSSSLETNFDMLKGHCRLILQVHDELVLEVDPSVVKEAALLLQTSMESAALLLVPLPVKLKIGRTWGSLEPFHADKHRNEVHVPDW